MTNEEMERRMEFILKQQESFADNLQQVSYTLKDVSERQDRLQTQQDKFQSQLERFQSQLESLTQATLGVITITGNLTKTVEQLAEAQKRTDAQVKEVAERLDVFINVVERYINESRNGKKGKS